MSVRRFCMKNKIGKKCKLSNQEIRMKIFECVQEVCFDTQNFIENIIIILFYRCYKFIIKT